MPTVAFVSPKSSTKALQKQLGQGSDKLSSCVDAATQTDIVEFADASTSCTLTQRNRSKSPSPHNKSSTSLVRKGAAKTPRQQQENLTARQVECSTCSQLKKDLHNQRLRNISVRDECNKLRARNVKLEEELAKTKQEIELMFDYSSFQDQEAVINQLKHSLSLNKTYIAQLEKSTQLSRSLLKDTLNTKLRYEKIIKKVMKNESEGRVRSIQSVINKTPLESSAQLESLNSVLPQMPTRPVEQKIKQKPSPKKKFTMSSKKLVHMKIFSRRN